MAVVGCVRSGGEGRGVVGKGERGNDMVKVGVEEKGVCKKIWR